MALTLGEVEWDSSFGDDSSFMFAMMKADIEDALKTIYSQEPGFKSIEILSFTEGSVIAEYRIQFYYDNIDNLRPDNFRETIVGTLNRNRKVLADKKINIAQIEILDLDWDSAKIDSFESTTGVSQTDKPNNNRAELIKPLMQIPFFGTLFANISKIMNKTTQEILEYFTGPATLSRAANMTTTTTILETTIAPVTVTEIKTACQIESAENTDFPVICTETGEYRSLQCTLQLCWCVTADGSKIAESELGMVNYFRSIFC
jgi:hypothetical protein